MKAERIVSVPLRGLVFRTAVTDNDWDDSLVEFPSPYGA